MQPGFAGVENGPALLLPESAPLIGATAPTLGVDGIEFSDAFEWLAGNRCGTADSKLVRQLARRRDDGHEPSRRRAAPCHPLRARNSRHSRPPGPGAIVAGVDAASLGTVLHDAPVARKQRRRMLSTPSCA
jgi:hypothetical protein